MDSTVFLFRRQKSRRIKGNLSRFPSLFPITSVLFFFFVFFLPSADNWVLMEVSDSPERNPCSPGEEDQRLSDDEALKESGSERELDGEGGRGSVLGEEEEDTARGLSQGEEENHSDEEDRLSEAKSQDSENNERSGELKSPPPRKGEEEERTNDLGDEASSVTRELDEHELDYDEEVPEEPSAAAAEEDGEKAAGEDDEEEEKGDDAHEDEKKSSGKSDDEKDGQDPVKEKKKEEDDGEIDDGEIDVSRSCSEGGKGLSLFEYLPLGCRAFFLLSPERAGWVPN